MKANTLTRNENFRMDYHDFRYVNNDANTTVPEHFFDNEITAKVYIQQGGNIVIYTQYPVRVGGRVHNIRDVTGKVLTGAPTRLKGYWYQVVTAEPVLNPFGFVDTMRYECNRLSAV